MTAESGSAVAHEPVSDEPVADEHCRGRPAEPLRPYVAWYTGYRQRGVASRLHRGLPSPFLTLIFTLDEPLVVLAHPDPRQPPGEFAALLGGLHSAPALIGQADVQSGIQVAVRPLGTRALLGLPAGELAGIDVPAESVLGGVCAELRVRLLAAAGWRERFAILDQVLLRLLGAQRRATERAAAPEVGWAWRQLLKSGGAMRMSELAAGTGWSGRHLVKRFHAEIGLTPKAAARVIRFTRAKDLLVRRAAAGNELQLADLAAACGYFDQAHLAREFRSLAGCPPSRWVAEEVRNVQAGALVDPEAWGGPALVRADAERNERVRRGRPKAMQETTQAAPEPQVWPTLGARDARALIRFLVDAFGFEETVVYGDGDRVDHAELSWPEGGGIMLGSERPGQTSSATTPGAFGAYVVTAKLDAVYERARAAGAEITTPPHGTDYGSRDFAARDPEGNRWSFGTYRGEPRKSG